LKAGSLTLCMSIAVFSMIIILGCDKKADENKPLDEVKAEAAEMAVEDLREMALEYKETIYANLEEIGKIKNKIKEMPLKEMFGDQAQELKQELEPIIKSINELKKRFWVYYSELKKKSADLSGLEL
jgi:uncharacterized coiled-coil DUF342 family protein